jgi:hypothetical protein
MKTFMRGTVVFGLLLASAVAAISGTDMDLDLAGDWSFRMDPDDAGVGEKWFEKALPDKIALPGSLQGQGHGNDVGLGTKWTGGLPADRSYFDDPRYAPYREPGNIKIPFWPQPEKHYVGAAWYQRAVRLPDAMSGKRLVLSLERCHWETTVWVDGTEIGSQNGLSTPHEYDLTGAFAAGGGKQHMLTVRVDNRMIVDVGGAMSVFGSKNNWNGIVGGIGLRATDFVWVDDVQIYPDVKTRSARVVVTIGNATKGGGSGTLRISATCTNTQRKHSPPPLEVPVRWEAGNGRAEFTYPLGDDAQLWDEFSPALYRMDIQLSAQDQEPRFRDARAVTFGLRNIATEGTQFVLNGHKVLLRGTLECATFPKAGYPATDVDSWKRIIRICKAHGLNHIRFHSWCPPEAAFTAADELGFYFQAEAACGFTRIGDGKPIDRWIYSESDRILRAYGNHPSFVLMAHGNEPRGRERGALFLEPWVKHFREKDPRRLYTGAAGWPSVKGADFYVPFWKFRMHGQFGAWKGFNDNPPQTTLDYRDRVGGYTVPNLSHEPGQWCVFPNLAEMPKYTGLLKPRNFEIVRDFLQEKGLLPQARDFLMASGKAQALLYKEEIEAYLRTPGLGGFQLLGLQDFPSAPVGVLDTFWDSKGYVTAEEHRQYCGPVVPLARMEKRIWLQGETFAAEVEVCQFGPDDLKDATVRWALLDPTAREVASGQWPKCDLLQGGLRPVGKIATPLATLEAPGKLTLRVWVEDTPWQNSWDLWVYPPHADTTAPDSVQVAETLDDRTVAHLRSGGRVLLLPPPGTIRGDTHGSFEVIFWSRADFPRQSTHTLGILCDPKHAALAEFPTESHLNWQWWDLTLRGKPVVMDNLPPGLFPIVQVIDDWNTCRKLGLVFEARIGTGKLLMCAVDLQTDLDKRPVARQMRHSLLQYAAGDAFAPQVEVGVDAIRALLK